MSYLKKIQKIFESCDINILFHWKSATFLILRNTDRDCILVHNFEFFLCLKLVLINVLAILMMWAKLATLDLFKIKVFWSKSYDIIIFFHDVSNKILLGNSNYVLDVVMWQIIVNPRISMRKVIVSSIFLEGCSWFKFNSLRLALVLKINVHMLCRLILIFVQVSWKKLAGEGDFLSDPILNRVK